MKQKLFILLITAIIFLGSCGSNILIPEEPSDNLDLSLNIPIPDYQGRNVTSGAESVPRVISPSTYKIEITLTAADIVTPIVKTVYITPEDLTEVCSDPDVYSNFRLDSEDDYDYSNMPYTGFGWAHIDLTDIPPGFDRTFEIKTWDNSDNLLTEGSTTEDLHMNYRNDVSVWMHPVNPVVITLDTPTIETIDHGKLQFYKLDTSALEGFIEFSLTSSHDLDMYLYNDYASIPSGGRNFWEVGAPTSEKAYYALDSYDDFVYVGIYGYDSESSMSFTLTATEYTGTSFNITAISTKTPGAFLSIWGDFQSTNVFENTTVVTGAYRPADIPFSFDFLGQTYNKVYISSNGYISFWPYGAYKRISSYTDDFPSNLIALYGTSYDIWEPDVEGVVYKTEGSEPNRKFIIEYHNIEDDYDETRKLTGQIILNESDNSIELLYDRATSTMTWDGFVGLVNEDWSDLIIPAESPNSDGWFPQIPVNDYKITNP